MAALNEELDEIAEEPQARFGRGAAEGAMTFPPKNQSNPRSVPYCSDSYFPGSDFSRHYARKRNYSPSLESVLRQELKSRLSTGVAHREINQDPAGYPGAAALSRGVGTGFHGADAEHNCGEHRSLPLNINGANTYQFVMSNPVGNVDPSGLSAIYDEMMGGSSPPGPAGGAGTISVYVVDRSGGRNTGFTGGHIDMVIPGVGVVGYYGTIPPGAGWAQAHGLGIPGFWNDSYNDFQGSRPMYVNPPGTGGYLSTIVKVPVTPEQLKRMRGELKKLEAHPGNFNIITNNCVENALKVLSAGGIDPNPWYHFGFDNPQDLVDQLNQEGDKEFNGYTVENPSGSVTIIPVLPAPAPAKAPGSSGGQAKC